MIESRLYIIEGHDYYSPNGIHLLSRDEAIVLKLQGFDVWDAHAALGMESEWIEDDSARNK
jgi:hypothetical protein